MLTGAINGIALLTLLLGNAYHARSIVASVLVMVWAVRTGGSSIYELTTLSFNRDRDLTKHRISIVPRAQNRQRLSL
jgi:hypothetical protein